MARQEHTVRTFTCDACGHATRDPERSELALWRGVGVHDLNGTHLTPNSYADVCPTCAEGKPLAQLVDEVSR